MKEVRGVAGGGGYRLLPQAIEGPPPGGAIVITQTVDVSLKFLNIRGRRKSSGL